MPTRLDRAVPLFLAAALSVSAARAQPIDAIPCSTLVVDASAENGFAIGPGQSTLELCSRGFVPAVSQGYNCTWGNRYHVDKHVAAWTATSSQPVVGFELSFRLDDAGTPGATVDPAPIVGDIPSPALFPDTTLDLEEPYVEATLQTNRRLANRWLLRDTDPSFWSCASLDPKTANRFVQVDRSPATPTQLCRARVDGGFWESCALQDPGLRALALGGHAAPLAGFGTSDQVVPPFTSPLSGSISVYYTGTPLPADPPPGDNTFRFFIRHDVPNPTAAHIHAGYPGLNGPIVFTFQDPHSPIDENDFTLPMEHEILGPNLYFDVHSAAHPEGEIRGQIFPAEPPLFGDGFESGDTSAWSSAFP